MIATDTFVVKANDGSLDSSDTTLTFNVTEIDTSKPQVLLTSSASSITETSDGSASLTVEAVLISNDFFSVRRDMNADPVSVGSQNSLNMIYVGEASGKKYYISRNDGSNQNDTGSESYSTASNAAENFGGYLAVFETQAEQQDVADLLDAAGYDGNYWIGYKYNYISKNWEWINGWTGGGSTMYTDSSNFDTTGGDDALENPYAYFLSIQTVDIWEEMAIGVIVMLILVSDIF